MFGFENPGIVRKTVSDFQNEIFKGISKSLWENGIKM